jgi:hypothetical protein
VRFRCWGSGLIKDEFHRLEFLEFGPLILRFLGPLYMSVGDPDFTRNLGFITLTQPAARRQLLLHLDQPIGPHDAPLEFRRDW